MRTEADSSGRVVLPGAEPGDVYEVQEQGKGRYLLVRLQSKTKMSREECLRAIDDHPLHFRMTWEELVRLTREP
ncbi:MAG TPA: hypothetical protein VLF66_11725 [Thermoanaerobaculia bacterium]|nr:hypothetical protein [Thermoanaerobaculia bacterium]